MITRIAYVVVNVSDLERARAFYEAVTPLRVVGSISARRQRMVGLGIESGEFEGYVLNDGTGGQPTAVHLVEWRSPKPVGAPYSVFWHVGLCRLGFATRVPSELRIARLAERGVRPTNARVVNGYVTIADPDGNLVSFVHLPSSSARYDHLVHTNPSQTQLGRSLRFYQGVLGLDPHLDVRTPHPVKSSAGPGANRAQFHSCFVACRGDIRFSIDLSEFQYPRHTLETSVPYAEANHLGICRVGFEVDDIDEAYAVLGSSERIGHAPGLAGPPEGWDMGPEMGKRRVVCFRDPDGVRLELVETPRLPSTRITFGVPGA